MAFAAAVVATFVTLAGLGGLAGFAAFGARRAGSVVVTRLELSFDLESTGCRRVTVPMTQRGTNESATCREKRHTRVWLQSPTPRKMHGAPPHQPTTVKWACCRSYNAASCRDVSANVVTHAQP